MSYGLAPNITEAVTTHAGDGVVVNATDNGFLVQLDRGGTLEAPLRWYEAPPGSREYVRCKYECGHTAHSVTCVLRQGHKGPHACKPANHASRDGLF